MLKEIFKKLNSERGSTLILALFFFLACIILGSAILAAGAASAGRTAGVAETDRRYYSLSSAAQFVADSIDGQSIGLSLTKTSNTVTLTELTDLGDGKTSRGTASVTESASYSGELISQDRSYAINRNDSFLSDLAINLVFGEFVSDFNGEAAWNAWGTGIAAEQNTGLSLKHGGENMSDLNAELKTVLQPDGTLLVYISDDGAGYTVEVVFTADIKTSEESNKETTDKTVTKNSDTSYTEKVTGKITEKKTSQITWTLKEIKRSSADD